ncbi:unnamed protein product, partial [Mesorhabditis spiculigera]
MLLFCLCVLSLNVLAGNYYDKYRKQPLGPGPFFELAGGFNRGEKLEIYFFTKLPGLELQLAEEPSKTYGFPVPLALLVMPDDPPLIKITHRKADQTAWNEVKKRPLDYFGWDNNCGCYEGMITILRTSTGGYEISFNTHKGPFHYTSTEENMIATYLVVRDPAIVGVKHHRAGFTGKFGPDQTKVAISWKTPGGFLKSPERKYWKTPNCRQEHMKRFYAAVEEYDKLEREGALKRRLRYQTDGNQTAHDDLEVVMLNHK